MSDHELRGEPKAFEPDNFPSFGDAAGALEDPVLAELDAYREAYRILQVLDMPARIRAVSWLLGALRPNMVPPMPNTHYPHS